MPISPTDALFATKPLSSPNGPARGPVHWNRPNPRRSLYRAGNGVDEDQFQWRFIARGITDTIRVTCFATPPRGLVAIDQSDWARHDADRLRFPNRGMVETDGNFQRIRSVSMASTVTETPDQELIDRCLAGRSEAFGLLVERYQHRLYGTLVHVVGSAEQARDVAQDAFLHAFEKLATFRGQSAFYSWLFRIALNAAVSARRKTARIHGSIDALREATGEEPLDGHGVAPWHAMHVSDRQRMVQRALADLPEEYRTALILKEMDELKYEEIAEILDVPIGTVRSRIHRARQELRSRLQVALQAEE